MEQTYHENKAIGSGYWDRYPERVRSALHKRFTTSATFYLVNIILWLIAVRPIADLQGQFNGESLNAGAIIGLVMAVASATLVLVHREYPRVYAPALACYLIIAYINMYHVISSGNIQVITETSRFLAGFTPFLCLPLFRVLSDRQLSRTIRSFIAWLCISSLVPIVITYLQVTGHYSYTYFDYIQGQAVGRPTGGYYHPSSIGRLMAVLSFLSLYLVQELRWKVQLCLLPLYISVLVMSTHRTSIVAGILGIIALVGLSVRGGRRFYVILLALTAVTIGGLILSFSEGIDLGAVLGTGVATVSSSSWNDGTFLRGRGTIWQTAWRDFSSSGGIAILLGMGYEPLESHNDILRILWANGVIGLIAYVGIAIASLRWAWNRATVNGKALLVALYLLWGLYSIPLEPTSYPNFMWLIFGGLVIASTSDKLAVCKRR